MGIGFAFVVVGVGGLVVACVCSAALWALVGRELSTASAEARDRARRFALGLPPLCVVCGACGFIPYAIWCEVIRNVDAGIGDAWHVPLGAGYDLVMIDTPDQAVVRSSTGHQYPIGPEAIGIDQHSIYFQIAPDAFRVLRRRDNAVLPDIPRAELASTLRALGSVGPQLTRAAEVYDRLRWTAADLVGALLVFGAPAALVLAFLRHLRRVRREARVEPALGMAPN